MTFAPRLASADSFLARIQVKGVAGVTTGDTEKAMLVSRASLMTAALSESGFQLVALGSPTSPALTFADGSAVAWLRLPAPLQATGVGFVGPTNAWDQAHARLEHVKSVLQAKGFTGDQEPTVFIEPNYKQPNVYDRSWTCPTGSSSGSQPQINGSPNKYWPTPTSGGLEWHLGDERTQLASASKATWEAQKNIRIAHLDTGIDPYQITLPANVDVAAERNFLNDTAGEGSATDPGKPAGLSGWACFNSHGTGTVSLLAGSMVETPAPYQAKGFLGAAPNTQIVPIRMADSVIHIYSVTMAEAIAYAALPVDKKGAGCNVISISAGGLPSQIWADAVNYAYENGVVIAAATGDNIHGLPTRGAVWPARFQRVIAVAGATANEKPYNGDSSDDPSRWMMEGSYGPVHVMDHAISAYTPNTAWAHWEAAASEPQGKHLKIDVDGGGTSASTPQVAGAAALYLAAHPGLPNDWRRAETVRQALFRTARRPGTTKDDHLYFGHGIVQAADAIKREPSTLPIDMVPADRICSPFLEALLGIDICDCARQQMLGLELAQLLASDAKYEFLHAGWDAPRTLSAEDQTKVGAVLAQLARDTRKSAQLTIALSTQAAKFGVS